MDFDERCVQALMQVVEEYGPPLNPEEDTSEQFKNVVTNPMYLPSN